MKKWIGSLIVVASCILATSTAVAQYIMVDGVGWEGQGAGIAITNLDNNPRPEMILMAYDNPSQQNNLRYKIGWNLDSSGVASRWDTNYKVVDGVGWEGQGAGIAIANLDGNARPEMILMAYDNPSQQNNFRYKIGWNLDSNGVASRWDTNYKVVDGVGWEGQGADVIVTNIDNDIRPDMILMAYDNPSQQNNFRYKIGWNLDSNGVASRWDTNYKVVDGVGWEGQGAGMAITNMDSNPRPELILMAYDNPSGQNNFRYKIGWNLNTNGVAQRWDTNYQMVDGVGWEGQGAGITVANINADPRPEIILMAYDNPSQQNNFRYKFIWDTVPAKRIRLEMDKLSSVNWPPASIIKNGVTNTLQSIYSATGISLNPVQNEGNIADLHQGAGYTDAELDSFRAAHMNSPPSDGSWHIYGAFMTTYTDPGILGIMFDTGQRRAFAAFANSAPDNAKYLRTTAHELGHALNLEHSDGDNWPTTGQGKSIMDQTGNLGADWDYGWSSAALWHYYFHPEDRWRPQSGVGFGNCH